MKTQRFYYLLALLWLPLCLFAGSKVSVVNLRTEMQTNPIGVGTATPRLSWQLQSEARDVVQKSYRLLVATSPEQLQKNRADLWDTRVVKSDKCNYIAYEGKTLPSGGRFYWKVIAVTNKGKAESTVAKWQNALMNNNEWQAQWIGRDYPTDVLKGKTKLRARYLRKDFRAEGSVTKATLYICGLGLYEAFINGKRVGSDVLAPTPTDYDRSVRYNTYDVTDLISSGDNAIGVVLGNGRFTSMRIAGGENFGIPQILHFGTPRLLARLELTVDGKTVAVCSDGTWKITANGPIGNNNEFDGEDYDARLEMPGWSNAGFNDASWQQAEVVSAPKGELLAQTNPNIRVMDKVRPIAVKELSGGRYVVDMGQNMVGWLRVKLLGSEGDTLRLRFAETVKDNGEIYTANLRSALATDTYIHNGKPSVWEPRFIYHGFRFVEVSGFNRKPSLDDIEGQVVYDQMATTGTFKSSNSMLNKIYNNAFWGIRGNYRGMPTDCPQRDERLGWLGDRSMGAQGECFVFDNHLLYSKWLRDIEETMRPDSMISDVAPRYWDVYNDDVTWPSAWFTVADMLYRQYGDVQPICNHYEAMKKWMKRIQSHHMKDGIVTHDTYGDWCMPPERPELIHSQDPTRRTDGALLSTSFYFDLARLMAKFAQLSGHEEDVQMWQTLQETTRKAFINKFYNTAEGYFGNNTVTANILPLRLGMIDGDDNKDVRRRVFDNIVKKTETDFNSHISTGLIGIQQLMRGLTDNGKGDLALRIATNTTYPSWGYTVENGATTIWELWNGNTANPAMNSGNHVMLLGDFVIWCYNYLAGIGQTDESIGFKHIQLKPRVINGLDNAAATYDCPYGRIESAWQKTADGFSWQFTIPCNTTARVYVPAQTTSLDGGKYVGTEGEYSVFEFPSGTYNISE